MMDRKPDNNKKPDKINIVSAIIACIVLTVLVNTLLSTYSSSMQTQVEYSAFLSLTETGAVDVVRFESDRLFFTIKESAARDKVLSILNKDSDGQSLFTDSVFQTGRVFYAGTIYDEQLLPMLKEKNVTFYVRVQNRNAIVDFFVSWVLPLIVFYVIAMLLMSRISKKMIGGEGGIFGAGRSNAKLYNIEKKTGVTFADFAGQEEAKESLAEMVDFLHSPEKYAEIGAKQPKGALLVGPPGTGKTLLAKAVAGEANVPFFSLSGSEFVEMYVGVGASRVRDLFKQAAKHAPCIIFIDEIDAIGKSREGSLNGNDEREQTLNQLLAEMDGFDTSKGIVILGATNRPEILDKALLRPGRFDRRVIVERPDLPGRQEILGVHSKKVKMESDIDLKKIALATPGASGADLANMINEAALRAVKFGRKFVSQLDLMESVEVVIAGKEKKDRILSEKEKRLVAFHEVGHALVSALSKDSQPVQKITIVPRTMGSLGYTLQMPEEEKYLTTKAELLTQITVLLGGRAAEEVKFSAETTGAANDIERATKLARSMVTQYGMSGAFDMMNLETIESRYLDGRPISTCSEATGAEIDKQILSIISECHTNAKRLLTENKEKMEEISEYLFQTETITGEQFMEILKGENTENEDAELAQE